MKVLFAAADFSESFDLDLLPAVGHYVRLHGKRYRVESAEWDTPQGPVQINLSEVVTFSQENGSEISD